MRLYKDYNSLNAVLKSAVTIYAGLDGISQCQRYENWKVSTLELVSNIRSGNIIEDTIHNVNIILRKFWLSFVKENL